MKTRPTGEDLRKFEEFCHRRYDGKDSYQPKTGRLCGCKPGVCRDNCPVCEGTGWQIDFEAIRRATQMV